MAKTQEDMTLQERIDAALVQAEAICAQCRPVAPRIESGPQSEAQWELDVFGEVGTFGEDL
jgi:hypothetical protein